MGTALLGSIIGALIGALGSWLVARRQLSTQRTQLEVARAARVDRALELYERFQYEFMRKARKVAWRARKKWYTDASYREKIIARFYQEDEDSGLNDVEIKEYAAIYDMIEFYSMLAVHKGNDEEIKAFGFYYTWWRGFLHEVWEAHERVYESFKLSDEEKAQFPPVPWVTHLDKLEKRLKLPAYKQKAHLLDRQYLSKTNENLI